MGTYPVLVFALPALLTAALKPETNAAFENYIKRAEAANAARADQLRSKDLLIKPINQKGETPVKGGLIHDWIGSIFIPGATLKSTLAIVQDYDRHKQYYKPEVADSKLLRRDGNDFYIYYRLMKKKVITVNLDTEHEGHYIPIDATHERSKSYSTKIEEIGGGDHGFLWRLNSYWRFEQADGGVYVECQAISLTRDVPTGLGWMIKPIIRDLPRESLANTLRSTAAAVAQK